MRLFLPGPGKAVFQRERSSVTPNAYNLAANPANALVSGYAGIYNYYRSAHGDTGYQIGSAVSFDGSTWRRSTEPAIAKGTGWESVDVAQPFIVNVNGTLYCYYSGYSGSNNAIGLATSTDGGLTWTKYASNPVISATLGFEGTQCYIPVLWYDPTDSTKPFKMWYAANGGAAMGYAYSTDGINWTKNASSVLGPTGAGWEQSLVSPQSVVVSGGTYYLFYAGYGDPGSNYPVSVGLVTFTDPQGTYTRSSNNPVLSPDAKTTTLTATCSSSATSITVADSTIFPVGCPIWVFDPAGGGNRFLTQVVGKPNGTTINMADAAPVSVSNGSSVKSASWHSVCSSGTPYFDGSNWRMGLVGFKGGNLDGLNEQAMKMYSSALDQAWTIDYAAGLTLPVPVSETTGTNTSTENLDFVSTTTSYAITGAPATFVHDYPLNAAPGSFSVTGAAATPLAARLINAAPGSYSLTGVDATLVYTTGGTAYTLVADPGSYALTGVAASTVVGRAINAAIGTFTLTGVAATPLAARLISADPGSFTLTGVAATLAKGYFVNSAPGSYTLTGFVTGFQYNRVIGSSPGAYNVTGIAVGIDTTGRNPYDLDEFPASPGTDLTEFAISGGPL